MLLTALTMRAGYRGGEIVPAFSIGATFGCVAGGILGFSPELAAAASMVAPFLRSDELSDYGNADFIRTVWIFRSSILSDRDINQLCGFRIL